MEQTGRLTLPTDADVVEETLRLKALLGADALRDCDGTEMPDALLQDPAKKYATYYTTRKDNAWAEANPDEIQQEYLISDRHTARSTTLRIHLMDGFHTQQLKVNTLDDPKRWWEVIDRTTGEVVPTDKWSFDEAAGEVEIETIPYHEYTVSFLAFLIWDPVHMYNFLTNDWKDTPHQLTYDVRQPKTQAYVKEKLRRWCEANPHIDVVRFTTFFHQFTLTFDDQKREKFVEWFGYSASVSPYILEKFEKWAGYKFRPEFIVDQGYHNTMFRVPSKEFKDFIEFQQQEVCALAKELVDIVHGHENVTIRDNYVKLAGGDGITVMYALRPLVEHNTADSVACEINDRVYSHPGDRAGKVAAGIWPWKCKDALFRCNEAADTRLNQDSMAYDADSGDGTVYEYNFSRQNEGGCVMFCLQEAIHNTFRHNVSFDDLGGTISPSENPDALIADNVFYVRDGVPFVRPQMGGGNYTAENNTFLPLEKFTP